MTDFPGGLNFGGDMFRNMMSDLLRMMPTGGGIQWSMSYQMAMQIAAGDGGTEPNPDPIDRIRYEELSAIAELHVAEALGMSIRPGGGSVKVVPATRAEWAKRILDTWIPVLERLAAATDVADSHPPAPAEHETTESVLPTDLGPIPDDLSGLNLGDPVVPMLSPEDPMLVPEDPMLVPEDPMFAMVGQMMSAMMPMMTAMQAGSVAGHLAETAIGQYDVPLAPVASDELLVVAPNVARLAEDWSLALDDVRLWVCVSEMALHAVLSRPPVAGRVADLVVAHATIARPDAESMRQLMQGVDPADPMAMAEMLNDPSAFLSEAAKRELSLVRSELDALTAAIAGYVGHVTNTIAARVIGNYGPIAEAVRRRRVSRGEGEKIAEALFGLSGEQGQVDRGTRYVEGVLERGGEVQLVRMWTDATRLPTAAEVDAPGLWLARLELADRP